VGGELCLADFEDYSSCLDAQYIISSKCAQSISSTSRDIENSVGRNRFIESVDYAAATTDPDALVENIIIQEGFLQQDFYAEYHAKQRVKVKNITAKHNATKTAGR
jgi:hypothetical protein